MPGNRQFKSFTFFGSLCYIIRDGENLDEMKEKCDACIFVGYSTQSKAYMVYNKRTRMIVETIHVNFDKLPQMASDQVSSDPEIDIMRATRHAPTNEAGIQTPSKTRLVTCTRWSARHMLPLHIATLVLIVPCAQSLADNVMWKILSFAKKSRLVAKGYAKKDRNWNFEEFCTKFVRLEAVESVRKPTVDLLTYIPDNVTFSRIAFYGLKTRHKSGVAKYDSEDTKKAWYLNSSRPDVVTCNMLLCSLSTAKPIEKNVSTAVLNGSFRFDHAGCLDSRKSTSGGIQFLGGDKSSQMVITKKRNAPLCSLVEVVVCVVICHSHLVVIPVPTFPYQALDVTISLLKGTGLKSDDSYEMFDFQ
ncbi:retrovirus-related pol polyprotein from transposon TNT 1-94 [Tanacetum coccineum]